MLDSDGNLSEDWQNRGDPSAYDRGGKREWLDGEFDRRMKKARRALRREFPDVERAYQEDREQKRQARKGPEGLQRLREAKQRGISILEVQE